jgi:dihydrofolate reductase
MTLSKVYFSVSISLDGYIAPDGMDLEHGHDPDYKDWARKWSALQDWALSQQFFQQNLQLGDDGETGPDNDRARHLFERTGVTILGKRMFDGGEQFWPEEAPFHTPVFVVTHQERAPWKRPGGTTFQFVNDGIESALARARAVADGRDIRIGGGADLIRQYVEARLVDEFTLSIAPVTLGGGIRLFEGIAPMLDRFTAVEAERSPRATHLTYAITGS